MMKYGVQQRPPSMARGRMDNHAGPLVDHQDVLILMDNVEGDVLGGSGSLLMRWQREIIDRAAAGRRSTIVDDHTVAGDAAAANQFADTGP